MIGSLIRFCFPPNVQTTPLKNICQVKGVSQLGLNMKKLQVYKFEHN